MSPCSVRENGTPKCSSSMTAAIALRHIYSIASWSPSQSDPLTVSYMCQRQSSGCMLPSEAEIPPCAATVCERGGNTPLAGTGVGPVGKYLGVQGVGKPRLAAADHCTQARAARTNHNHVVSV